MFTVIFSHKRNVQCYSCLLSVRMLQWLCVLVTYFAVNVKIVLLCAGLMELWATCQNLLKHLVVRTVRQWTPSRSACCGEIKVDRCSNWKHYFWNYFFLKLFLLHRNISVIVGILVLQMLADDEKIFVYMCEYFAVFTTSTFAFLLSPWFFFFKQICWMDISHDLSSINQVEVQKNPWNA